MKQRCTIADPQHGGTCPNDARATCTWPGAGIAHACAAHLGLLAVEHGQKLSVYTLGAPAPEADRWEANRE